jgi:hypothetical protein
MSPNSTTMRLQHIRLVNRARTDAHAAFEASTIALLDKISVFHPSTLIAVVALSHVVLRS